MTDPAGTSGNRARRRDASRRRPDQLPSGRHGLLPSAVAANQRERILAAVLSAGAERGYAEMSVEAITARAGVSRRTFYEHFKNKEDAFVAAYDAVVHQAAAQVRRAYLNETTALERLRAGITAFLQFLAADPQAARTGIVEVLAAGPRAIARRNAAVALFAEIIEDNLQHLVPSCRQPGLTAQTIVGGILEVVLQHVLAGRTSDLPGLADDLLTSVLMLDIDPQQLSPAASVRLLAPDAAGRPLEASSAASTAMFFTPPGPQPLTPGAENVVSLAVDWVARTKVSGCIFGCGSVSCDPLPRVSVGLSTTGSPIVPMVQLLPSSGLISLNITGCVQLRRLKFVIGPASSASAYTSRYRPPKFCAFTHRFSTTWLLLGQPSAVVRLSGIRSGLVVSMADTPAGGGTTSA